ESKWPGKLCQSGGKRQSPIDIRTDDVVRDFRKEFIKYGPLKFTGYKKVLTTGINNGHTIQFSTEGEDLMHPLISGGPLKYRYRLEQLHFHWLSEHAVNGVKYPMEIHFVHVRADLTVNQALHRKDGLAIVSVFGNKDIAVYHSPVTQRSRHNQYQSTTWETRTHVLFKMPHNYKRKTETKYSLEDLKKAIVDVQTKKLSIGRAANTCVPKTTIYLNNVQSELDDSDLHMGEVMTHVPKLMRPGNRLSGVLLDMSKLLNVDKSSYYTYAGSLTSPDCNEAVIWIIFTTPIVLTDAQYRMFANIGIVRHNFRSLQKVNQQVVYMPVEVKVKVPHIVQFFVDVGRAVTDFFKNFGTPRFARRSPTTVITGLRTASYPCSPRTIENQTRACSASCLARASKSYQIATDGAQFVSNGIHVR
ncbi:hypothetical protein SFRURICE_013172, partial [Spodoptera frugiperda]